MYVQYMFGELYLKTTDPHFRWQQLLEAPLLYMWILSVLYHIILYTCFANLVSYVFLGRLLSLAVNQRFIACVSVILLFGYFGRIQYVKDLYKGYHHNREATRRHTDQFFISWVFLG